MELTAMLTSERITFYLGSFNSCHAGYSASSGVRANASSGGIVSSILIYLLETQRIDGAVVSRLSTKSSGLQPETIIATTAREIMDYAGSVYVDIPVLKTLRKLPDFKGKVAFVGLPCHLKAIEVMCRKNKVLQDQIAYKIGLFCGNNVRLTLYKRLFRERNIDESKVLRVSFKRQHFTGVMHVSMKNSDDIQIPFNHFNVYRMLGFHLKRSCIHCTDHTAERADFSVGDIFTKEYKAKKIKHSAVILRNRSSEVIFKELMIKGLINAHQIEPETVYKAQKRALIFRKNISARSKAGKLLNISIKDDNTMQVRWNDLLAALLFLFNIKIGENNLFDKALFKIPRPFLYIEVLILKALANF